LKQDDPLSDHLKALATYWSLCEIGAVGLVDMRVWHWMYDHPDATAEDLKHAVINIAQEIWNRYYAPLIGIDDVILLGIYSHMISGGLYLPDYSIGQIVMFQIENYIKKKNLGTEMERMCSLGRLSPDAWMMQAVGAPISTQPLITAAENAIKALEKNKDATETQ
jgi:hypothetical protein